MYYLKIFSDIKFIFITSRHFNIPFVYFINRLNVLNVGCRRMDTKNSRNNDIML
jgi:hypothetical protein